MTATTSTIAPARRRRRAGIPAAAAALVLLGALLAGCSASGGSGATSQELGDSAGGPAQGGNGAADSANLPAAAATAGAASGADSSAADRQVVKNGEMSLEVDDPLAAADRVAQIADELGGRVDDREQQAGEDGAAGSATMTIRVPADSLDRAVSELGGLGDVTRYTEKTQDVTGTVVDLDARITAAQTSVDRVQGFLERATSTKELLDTEQALSQRQSDLEQLRGQRTALADQVSMSTLQVSLTAPGHPVIEAPGPRSFAGGLGVGWRSLLAALRGASVALGVLLPWLVVGLVVAAAIVLPARRRRRSAALTPALATGAPPTAPAAPPVPPTPGPTPPGPPA